MSCFHPNIITYVPDGILKDGDLLRNKDGSIKRWRFQGAGFEEKKDDGSFVYRLEKNKNAFCFPLNFDEISSNGVIEYSLMVPCQQCRGCRIDYSRHWADRIVMESLTSLPHSCFFVTLTYSEPELQRLLTGYRYEYTVDGNTYDLRAATLIKKDLQDFNKRLREYYSRVYNHDNIRFYACGEYGHNTRRPHFHVCYFNLPIQDLEVYSNNFRGDVLYISPTLEKLWGHGFVVIGELTWESAAYTARYVVKKWKGLEADEFYEKVGHVLPEFSLASNRPGIGGMYYELHKHEIYKYDQIQLPSSDKRDGITSVPRYFDKLLEKYQKEHPDDTSIEKIEKIKLQRRQLSEDRKYNQRFLTGLFDKEYFRLKEESFNKTTALLQRSLDI